MQEKTNYDVVMTLRNQKQDLNPYQLVGKGFSYESGPTVVKIDIDKIRFLGEDYGEIKLLVYKKNKNNEHRKDK